MDTSDTGTKNCAVKTDLNLLLECLKCQMNFPDSQKQALLTINSICERKEEVIDYFQNIGGVGFVYNLSQSSEHTKVKEAALFTLGTMVESNVFCQQALCVADIFKDLARSLMQDFPQSLKRTVVYFLSVLVTNNRTGQTLAKATGCIDTLLKLFSSCFPIRGSSVGAGNATELYQLWAAVSSALCSCVTNPQNEENQQLCTSTFLVVKMWLQEIVLPRKEIVQPICSFIAMTVANNSCAQDHFASVGGLSMLVQCVLRLVPQSARSAVTREAAVAVTRALCACIGENTPLAAGLAQHQLVPQLLALLSCPALCPADQLCIVLTLGHCTEASVAHQCQLLQSGGLSHMIVLLAESQDEELKKATTYVLQSCRQMTKALGTGRRSSPLQGDTCDLGGPDDFRQWDELPCDLEGYRRSAQDMLHRIDRLERAQIEDLPEAAVEQNQCSENSVDKWLGPEMEPRCMPMLSPIEFSVGTPCRKVRGAKAGTRTRSLEMLQGLGDRKELTLAGSVGFRQKVAGRGPDREAKDSKKACSCQAKVQEVQMGHVKRQIFQIADEPDGVTLPQWILASSERAGTGSGPVWQETLPATGNDVIELQDGAAGTQESTGQGGVLCSVCGVRSLPDSPSRWTELCRESVSVPTTLMSQPVTVKEIWNKPQVQDHLSLCSEILDNEISSMLKTPASTKRPVSFRCSGCVIGLSLANSRNILQILHSCQHKCDRHMVLLEVEGRFKSTIRELGRKKPRSPRHPGCPRLTPLNKRESLRSPSTGTCKTTDRLCISLTPVKKFQNTKDKRVHQADVNSVKPCPERTYGNVPSVLESGTLQRREGKDFTTEEVQYFSRRREEARPILEHHPVVLPLLGRANQCGFGEKIPPLTED